MAIRSLFQSTSVKLSEPLKALERRLQYKFATPSLLIEAMTHPSFAAESHEMRNNQRMEFLGDRVLGLVIATQLLNQFKEDDEGRLAPKFNALVRKEACAEIAENLHLGDALKMGRSETRSGGRRKEAILGDAMEAVIAAIYLDGGFSAAQKVILHHWAGLLERSDKTEARDAKTRLQEWAQARGMTPPIYELRARSGPDHDPRFVIEAILQNGERAKARASSKRAAQQEAAAKLLTQLGEDNAGE